MCGMGVEWLDIATVTKGGVGSLRRVNCKGP